MTEDIKQIGPVYRDGSYVVLVDRDEAYGDEWRRRFWVPEGGGYVREILSSDRPGMLGQQVCEHLHHLGTTLSSTREHLPALILAEYRRREAEAAVERARARGELGEE